MTENIDWSEFKADSEFRSSSGYDLFIVALTLYSLVIILLMVLLPRNSPSWGILFIMDTMVSLVFLGDFFFRLYIHSDRWGYFRTVGWLDLLGSLPVIPIFRLARIARVLRVTRAFRLMHGRDIWHEIWEQRAQNALFFTLLVIIVVITFGSIAMVAVESSATDAEITTSGDALWWSLVTITTVGYGDLVPVTGTGRTIATLFMVIGLGVFGVLTSYLSSVFIGDPAGEGDAAAVENTAQKEILALRREVGSLEGEMVQIRRLLEEQRAFLEGRSGD